MQRNGAKGSMRTDRPSRRVTLQRAIDVAGPSQPPCGAQKGGFSLLGMGEAASLLLVIGLAAAVVVALAVVVLFGRRRKGRGERVAPREGPRDVEGPPKGPSS